MPQSKEIIGSVAIVWFSDGKQKYRFVNDVEDMKKEIKRLHDSGISNRAIAGLLIDWTNQTVLGFIGEKPEDMPS